MDPLNIDNIRQSIKKSKLIIYKVYKIDKNVSNLLIEIVEIILKEVKKEFLYDYLAYILREFISNANKSNLKRIHFKEQALDINNLAQYTKGMKTFADDFRYKFDEYSELLKKLKFYN